MNSYRPSLADLDDHNENASPPKEKYKPSLADLDNPEAKAASRKFGSHIPHGVEDYMFPQPTNEQRANTLKGLAQGAENVGIGYLNMLPKVDIEKAKWAGESPEAKSGELAADIGSYFGPGLALKGAGFLPLIGKIVKSGFESLKSRPALNAISRVGKAAGENALASAALADKDKQGEAAKTGAEWGGGANILAQSLGVKNPILNALLRAAVGGGGGYAVGNLTGQNPLHTAAYGAGAGVGLPYATKALGIGAAPAGLETLEHLTKSEVQPAVNAANRLGTPITPAEASGNPFVGGIEGRYGRTGEAAALKTGIGQERIGKQNEAIRDLLDTIHDKSTPKAAAASAKNIKKLYDQAYTWNLNPAEMSQIRSDPVVNAAFKRVKNDPAYQRKLQGIPESNYAYLNQVRRAITDMEKKALGASNEGEKAAELKEARQELVKIMDNKAPVYKEARREAQKQIVRNNLEKTLGTSEIKGSTFFNKLLRNENKFQDLQRKLKHVPEAQDQLRDMQLAWKNLINIEKPNTTSYRAETGLSQSRNWANKVVDIWNEMTGAKKNIEALKFIHSGEWDKSFARIAEMKDAAQRQEAMINLMTKLTAANESRKAVVKE